MKIAKPIGRIAFLRSIRRHWELDSPKRASALQQPSRLFSNHLYLESYSHGPYRSCRKYIGCSSTHRLQSMDIKCLPSRCAGPSLNLLMVSSSRRQTPPGLSMCPNAANQMTRILRLNTLQRRSIELDSFVLLSLSVQGGKYYFFGKFHGLDEYSPLKYSTASVLPFDVQYR